MSDHTEPCMREQIQDHGCPLVVHAGGHAPEYKDEYSIGGWMGPPNARWSVCDSCVRKIRNCEVTNYRLNEVTLEVTENHSEGK